MWVRVCFCATDCKSVLCSLFSLCCQTSVGTIIWFLLCFFSDLLKRSASFFSTEKKPVKLIVACVFVCVCVCVPIFLVLLSSEDSKKKKRSLQQKRRSGETFRKRPTRNSYHRSVSGRVSVWRGGKTKQLWCSRKTELHRKRCAASFFHCNDPVPVFCRLWFSFFHFFFPSWPPNHNDHSIPCQRNSWKK